MIKFTGKVDNKIKRKVIKQRDKEASWLMLCGSIIGIFATIICAIVERAIDYKLLIPTIFLIILTIIFFVAPITSRDLRIDWFYTVCIENGTIQKTQLGQPELVMKIDQIKKVIDDGDYYTVIYAGLSNAIICQKSLLAEGTLEEFEEVFRDKLKRRKKLRRKTEEKTSEKKDEKNL